MALCSLWQLPLVFGRCSRTSGPSYAPQPSRCTRGRDYVLSRIGHRRPGASERGSLSNECALMFKQLYSSVVSNSWLYAPAGGVLVFAAILHFILRRPTPGAQRGGLLFGVGFIAVFATGVFAAFAYSLLRLVTSGRANFDLVGSVGGIVAGALAVWLWLRFVRLWRGA